MKRNSKICIITGSRAEWGIFYPLACKLKESEFVLQIIATGSHLSKRHGLTYKEIEKDGFEIDYKTEIPLTDDTEEAMAKSTSDGIAQCTKGLQCLEPDLVFLLGDRFEIFAAAVAATALKIPIAHIHGGELTEGSMDNTFRHAITKMSHLHFVACDVYRNRVIQMGEDPSTVFNVGALAVDNIMRLRGEK